jgi:hypothetical protein
MMKKAGASVVQTEQSLSSAPPLTRTTISLGQRKRDPVPNRFVNMLSQKYMVVKLVQHEFDAILLVYLLERQRVFIGRGDPELKPNVDIDLSAYGGRVKGVSRLHAALRRVDNQLAIVDLNSANGTYSNGTRLLPGQSHFLRSGDKLCFGKLFFQIHFGY